MFPIGERRDRLDWAEPTKILRWREDRQPAQVQTMARPSRRTTLAVLDHRVSTSDEAEDEEDDRSAKEPGKDPVAAGFQSVVAAHDREHYGTC
jgi:hypothetical protein